MTQQQQRRFVFLSQDRIEWLKNMPLKYRLLLASQVLFTIFATKYAQSLIKTDGTVNSSITTTTTTTKDIKIRDSTELNEIENKQAK